MQYVFLIRSRAGCKKYVTRLRLVRYFLTASARAYQKHVLHGQETVSIIIANLHAILTIFYTKTMGLSFIADYDSERVCRWGVFLNLVRLRPIGSTPFNAFLF